MATRSAELDLLAASGAGRPEVARRVAVVVALRGDGLGWDRVLAAARRHRMAGFRRRALMGVGVAPPEPVAGALPDLAVAAMIDGAGDDVVRRFHQASFDRGVGRAPS